MSGSVVILQLRHQRPQRGGMQPMLCTDPLSILLLSQSWKNIKKKLYALYACMFCGSVLHLEKLQPVDF